MPNKQIEDPAFGELEWAGKYSGWVGVFESKKLSACGACVFSDRDEDEDEQEGPYANYSPKERRIARLKDSSPKDFLKAAALEAGQTIAQTIEELGGQYEAMEQVETWFKLRQKMRATYLGSDPYEPHKLRRQGRFRVVVRNDNRTKPTEAQQDAWGLIIDGGSKLMSAVLERLLTVYKEQLPERRAWWKSLYGDGYGNGLPSARTLKQLTELVRLQEARVLREAGGTVTIALVFETTWAYHSKHGLAVLVEEGEVVDIVPEDKPHSRSRSMYNPIDHPLLGPMFYEDEKWWCRQPVPYFCGMRNASLLRYMFKNRAKLYGNTTDTFQDNTRELPNWDTITGDFQVGFASDLDDGPSAGQVKALRAFIADIDGLAYDILEVIAVFYSELREEALACETPDPFGFRDATWPEVKDPNQLLEVMELGYIAVDYPKSGKQAVPIGLIFNWEDEHGVGVVVRDGEIEEVGYADIAMFG